jgi:transglutaminase-like putative cysteine protease
MRGHPLRRIVAALWLLCLCLDARAADQTWYSVHLDGRKIGHMLSVRALEPDGRVRHEQTLSLTLERNGEKLALATEERTWESPTGTPLAFEHRIDSAGSTTRTRGTIEGERLDVITRQQGQEQRQRLSWPSGALLPEGQRLAAERAGFAPGTRYQTIAFDPGALLGLRTVTEVGTEETVELRGVRERLIPLTQTLDLGGVQTRSVSWVTPVGHALRRLRLPAIGLQLEMVACDRACALAPVQPTDVLASTLVAAPRPLSPAQLSRPLQYRLRLAHGKGESMDAVPGQTLHALAGRGEVRLIVDPRGESAAPPRADDLASNRWLQADAEEVVTLARQAAKGARGPAQQVAQLERFVRGYIRVKSLRVGYASAREIVQGREGDCTEHAVLLAAMTRALGIPARVATGIAYAPGYAGRRDVFVPHAWVLAWVDGAWRGLDAALPRFDAGHIGFTAGDGDPFRFYGGIELLGGIEILAVERPAGRSVAR